MRTLIAPTLIWLSVILPVEAHCASNDNDYFAIGPWQLGMKMSEALPLFDGVELREAKTYRGAAHSVFGADVPATLTFEKDRLKGVNLVLYEGEDREAAILKLEEVLGYFRQHFGGSSLEGLTTTEDPEGKLTRVVVNGMLEKVQKAFSEAREQTASENTFSMRLSFSTEYKAEGNSLYGQFRYEEDSKRYTVELWEDPEFVKSRVPKSHVYIRTPQESSR